jgi:SAM-dependent methyltransferase
VFRNVYEDAGYAHAYAGLEWTGTYALVRRDLPGILRQHVTGRRALDFGCGTGRSTRLLRSCGFDVAGVDISPSMLAAAREIDPAGDYRLLDGPGLDGLTPGSYDLVLAAFPFDNVPAPEKPGLFRALRAALAATGRLVNIVSSPEIYTHEWASFSTRDYPGNRHARDGDTVRIVTTEFGDARPAEDVLCTDGAYRDIYSRSGLEVVATYRPLAGDDVGAQWVSEARIAPWVIYVLKAISQDARRETNEVEEGKA